jgi:hypothetical protein
VASVLIDRVVGLVAMLVVASAGLLLSGATLGPAAIWQSIRVFVWSAATLGVAALLLLVSSLTSGERAQERIAKVPIVGHYLLQLSQGLAVFRSRRKYLLVAFALACATHCLLVSAFWCISRGLPIVGPTFQQNATIVPLALVAGAIPLTPGGLGIMETGLAKLFAIIGLNQAEGAMVALSYRALTYVVAALGACYYLSAKRRMDALLSEAESLADELE